MMMDNGTTCLGEYAFCLMLYRLAYPTRLITLQREFGREYSQLSRIFNAAITWTERHHIHRVQGQRIINWFSARFDLYHRTILRKMLSSTWNPNVGFVPAQLANIFAFLDGTGLEIARPVNGAQNPFYNGYMHGHYLIFQGISFPDGLTLVEGPWSGHHTDIMCWNGSDFRTVLDAIMTAREAEQPVRQRLKVCV